MVSDIIRQPQAEGVEKRVLRKTVGHLREDIIRSSKNCMICNCHKIIMRVIKSRRRRWVGSVVCSTQRCMYGLGGKT
jgi:hypothetical protein